MSGFDKTFLENNQLRTKQSDAFVSIRYCVMNSINRVGDNSMNEYFYLLQLAIDMVRELNIYHQDSIEVAYLIPNEAGIVEYPSDMIEYIKIGIPINGQLYNLTVNNNMLLNRATKCGVDIRQIETGASVPVDAGYTYASHMRGNTFITGLYGLGGGFNTAYFRDDKTARQFQFDGIVPNREIIMEYKSTGLKAGSIISAAAIPVIREYILWQRIENDPRVGANQKDRKKNQFDEALATFRDFSNMFTIEQYLDLSYRAMRQSPKR